MLGGGCCWVFQVLLIGRKFLDNLHVLKRLAIDHLASLGSENLVRNQVVPPEDLQQLSLDEDLREQSSTGNLLSLASDSFIDCPAQMVHDIPRKVNLV